MNYLNYVIGLLAVAAAVLCFLVFPIPTVIGLAVAVVWWWLKGRHRSVR
ncbi:hypothetical protein [uncultured Aquabacterium sp.]|jgi:hypothetical protein|nr:hypothetical protein [uncultured Aquabacterium sp.]